MNFIRDLEKPFRDLKATFICADDSACGNYRMLFPAHFLQQGGAQIELIQQRMPGGFSPDSDIILCQRQYDPSIYEAAMESQFLGKTIIYEIDDNVHQVAPTSVAFTVYKPGSEICHSIAKFIRSSDGFFTTTPELASAYGEMAKRSWVLPNMIDFGVRDWETSVERDPRLQDKIVVGWCGSITHEGDWMPLVGVLDKILAKYPNVVIALVSAYQTMQIFVDKLNLPLDRVVQLDPVDFQEYPKLPAQFDIGLIPVANTLFNQGKSPLKILEYGARRVPYVATNLPPYVRFHAETGGQGGCIATCQSEWVDAISRLVEDEQERREKSEFLFDYVRENYAYDRGVHLWADALRECKAMKKLSPEAERKFVIPKDLSRNSACPCGATKPDGNPIKYKNCKEHYGSWGRA